MVILGAGASIAAYLAWGKEGKEPPSMQNLIDTLSLRSDITNAGYEVDGINFEGFYDELSSSGKNEDLLQLIETRVYEFFSSLSLPNKPTIYDYLILSLREKDLIATFNWDPFLLQAYLRSEDIAGTRRPRLAFLHGNVGVGICEKDKVSAVNGRPCPRCGDVLAPSKLLYPVKHKDYSSDAFIKNQWANLRDMLGHAYFLTIFGYSAPVTDIEARSLMLDEWKNNPTLELAEIELFDIKTEEEIERSWRDFLHERHYGIYKDISDSYIFRHPRRSCDAFSAATLMCAPWRENRLPGFKTLPELWEWFSVLVEEEERCERNGLSFSGIPIP